MEKIAVIKNDFVEKFGIPRQSGMADTVISKIVFEPEYRDANAFRGLEEYSHIWLLWLFSENMLQSDEQNYDVEPGKSWSPTVRPPKLGGNKRVGVFATRSPFRPNPIGMSCVKLEKIDFDSTEGPVLYVRGADIMNGTPIIDIKPYLPYADSHPEARGGFGEKKRDFRMPVQFPLEISRKMGNRMTLDQRDALADILSLDPRTSYQDDTDREYGMTYGKFNIKFRVEDGVLRVTDITEL